MDKFKLVSDYKPAGDQPKAISQIVEGLEKQIPRQTLLGVTGSGKTFTMANIIEQANRPVLIISHNKTLAAQLYNEFKLFFPENAVEYFVSYYDYYQPEAYIPHTDTYIEKDSSVNDEIERLRLKATASLAQRRDVVIISSVSCIYGLGSPKEFMSQSVLVRKGESPSRDSLLRRLVDIQYSRNDIEFGRGTFRVRGDTLDVHPAYEDEIIRLEFFGDEVERIVKIHSVTGNVLQEIPFAHIFPATHYVTPQSEVERVVGTIEQELHERLEVLHKENKLLEAQRLASRTKYDLEMIQEIGYCSGVENYSRIFDNRAPGSTPFTLLDYFPEDFIVFIDESHVTLPQIHGMYNGDKARKTNLVEYGFRLPCAMDNRPLKFEEFEKRVNQVVFVSATPAEYELKESHGVLVEQVVRPTGLVDPKIEVHPVTHQVDHLLGRIRERLAVKERVMVTTLTKKMAEDLTDYLFKLGVPVRYLHSDIDTLERAEIIRDFRKGVFEVLIGINLLREGLDLPEVSLVAILDADKEGFLRSERSLIQTIGRASRNLNGTVILYADKITDSMKRAMSETERRRKAQEDYNREHNIIPKGIVRKIEEPLSLGETKKENKKDKLDLRKVTDIDYLTDLMNGAASALEFEKAAKIRDRIQALREELKKV